MYRLGSNEHESSFKGDWAEIDKKEVKLKKGNKLRLANIKTKTEKEVLRADETIDFVVSSSPLNRNMQK